MVNIRVEEIEELFFNSFNIKTKRRKPNRAISRADLRLRDEHKKIKERILKQVGLI